jgi:hypothetical protein
MRTPSVPNVDALLVKDCEVFYDGKRYLMDNGTKYVPLDRTSLKSQLKSKGIADPDAVINHIQTEKYVEYAGPLAGRKRGLHSYEGHHLLATCSPTVIKAKRGKYPTIKKFIQRLLGGDEHADVQCDRFMGWLKAARMAMLAGERRPGQALVLAGPADCGKTQLIDQIVVPSIGGRSGKAYSYLSGATRFNSDLIGAEVLVADDETNNTHLASRRTFGEGIKGALFPAAIQMEGKFRDPYSFPLLWRVVIAVNDDAASLMVLPPLTKDISNKLMILRCQRGVDISEGEFEQWRSGIKEEMPAFLHAVELFQVTEDGPEFSRCGVSTFHHPDIVRAVEEMSPERQLLALIDGSNSQGGPRDISLPWDGSALDLQTLMTEQGAYGHKEASKLLDFHTTLGKLLSTLAGSPASGVSRLTVRNGTQWYRIDRSKIPRQELHGELFEEDE